MKRTICWTLALLTLVGTAQAQEAAKVKANINTQYQQMIKKLLNKQLKAYWEHVTPDFRVKYLGQTYQRKQYEALTLQAFRDFSDVKMTFQIQKFTLNKDKATIQKLMTQSGKTRNPTQGLPANFVLTVTTTDEWVKTSKGWKMKSMNAYLTAPPPKTSPK